MDAAPSLSSEAVVKITDSKFNDLYSNQVLAQLSGYSVEELDHMGWVSIVDPAAQSLFEEIIRTVETRPYVRECFQTNIVCRNGTKRPLAWEVISLAPDQFPVMLITAREVPEMAGAEPVAERTQRVAPIPGALWEEVFDALPDSVSIHDEDFTILAANKALCDRLGVPRSEIVGRKCHELFHGTDHPIEHCVLVQSILSPQPRRVRTEFFEAKLKCICQVEAAPLPGRQSGRAIVHTVRAQRTAESDSTDGSSDTLESLSNLANAVAHDYNNLLSGIVGYVGMLQMMSDLPDKAKSYLAELQKAGSRLSDMTQRLLLFGRKRVAFAQPVDLNRLVEDALKAKDVVPADRSVDYSIPEEPVRAVADPMQTRVVLSNLVRNALEATMRAGGEVFVRVFRFKTAKPYPTFFMLAPAGDYACFEVRDSGPGIEPDRLTHLFEPFVQAEGRPVARGLGLAVVARVVRNHRGFLEVESELGAGTRIAVMLPAAPAARE